MACGSGARELRAIAADVLPIFSYFDFTNLDLKVVKCGNASCSSGNAITTLDADGSVGTHTSIAVAADDLPIISYYDDTNGNLKVVKCGTADCASDNTVSTVDSAGDAGQYSSIAIGIDNLPVISYMKDTTFYYYLKVVKCGNASCSSGNSIITLDAADVGWYTSIAMGADDLPIVSYYDYANGYLKVVKCGKADCSEGTGALHHGFDLGQLISVSMVGGVLTIITSGNRGLIQVVNITGKMVFQSLVSKHGRFEIPGLVQGIYFVRVVPEPGREMTSAKGGFVHKVSILE